MIFRKYQQEDLPEILRLFHDTVHSICSGDYTAAQLDAWAPDSFDTDVQKRWHCTLTEHFTVIAEEGLVITGFGDIDDTGYLDRLYVHKDYQRQGIASGICDRLEAHASPNIITTHASITAKPFFQKRGYHVAARQTVERHGILLTNFIMKKE